MPFPLGIHLLPGLAVPQNHRSGPNLNKAGPQKSFKGMMALCTCHCKSLKLLSQDAMKALKAYNTEAINRFHKRKVHNTDGLEIPQDDAPEPFWPF